MIEKKKFLNLGCGNRFFSDWVNIDFVSNAQEVQAHNLLSGIPMADASFEAVYHSHVLEHFPKEKALLFLQECHRVLKPEGVLRVVVPDLEQIARLYIQQLEQVLESPSEVNQANYDWAVIELYDQTVRNTSGGAMGAYWSKSQLINESWIASRMGDEFKRFRAGLADRSGSMKPSQPKTRTASPLAKLANWKTYRDKLLLWLSGEPKLFEYVQLGKFRLGGEVHQWMYDRYSLARLLHQAGFKSTKVVTAHDSQIPQWEKHQWLDIEQGSVRKPDSLFMEAIK